MRKSDAIFHFHPLAALRFVRRQVLSIDRIMFFGGLNDPTEKLRKEQKKELEKRSKATAARGKTPGRGAATGKQSKHKRGNQNEKQEEGEAIRGALESRVTRSRGGRRIETWDSHAKGG